MSLCPSRSYAIADHVKATLVMHVTMSSRVDFVAGSSAKRSFIVHIRPCKVRIESFRAPALTPSPAERVSRLS
jgi:hypothetical protein